MLAGTSCRVKQMVRKASKAIPLVLDHVPVEVSVVHVKKLVTTNTQVVLCNVCKSGSRYSLLFLLILAACQHSSQHLYRSSKVTSDSERAGRL